MRKKFVCFLFLVLTENVIFPEKLYFSYYILREITYIFSYYVPDLERESKKQIVVV